jgi:hypothetical protein
MTRQQITSEVRDLLVEFKGEPGFDTPFGLDLLVTQAANDVARATDCYEVAITGNLTSGAMDYAGPYTAVYKPKRVYCGDGAGNTVYLDCITIDDFNRWRWKFVNPSTGAANVGIPAYYMIYSVEDIRLLPTPNYSVTNGLTVEGFAYPSLTWAADTAPCPLPVESHMTVAIRAALMRCAQFPSADNTARAASLRALYNTQLAEIKGGDARQASAQTTRGANTDANVPGPYTPI